MKASRGNRYGRRSAIVKEKVELAVADGTRMAAYVARPEHGGPHPGLLVFQEAFGVNHHIRNVTERFAAEGYVAIAPELFHRTAPPGFEGSYTDFPVCDAALPGGDNGDGRGGYTVGIRVAAFECAGKGGRDFVRGILHGRPCFIYREQRGCVARGGFVLRRRNRSRIAGSGFEAAGSIIIYMGRIGQAHYAGAPTSGDRGFERSRRRFM